MYARVNTLNKGDDCDDDDDDDDDVNSSSSSSNNNNNNNNTQEGSQFSVVVRVSRSGDRISGSGKTFFCSPNVRTCSGAHPASYSVGAEAFCGRKGG
jgi:hypothetical protein